MRKIKFISDVIISIFIFCLIFDSREILDKNWLFALDHICDTAAKCLGRFCKALKICNLATRLTQAIGSSHSESGRSNYSWLVSIVQMGLRKLLLCLVAALLAFSIDRGK